MKYSYVSGYKVYENSEVISPKGKKIKWQEDHKGYLFTRIKWFGQWKGIYLHTLVCIAFHGERPEGMETDHIDGDKKNNHKDNLRWVTKSKNNRNSYLNNRDVSGTRNANSKLTENQVKDICKHLEDGYDNISNLSRILGYNRATISAIKNKRQWLSISKNYNF